MKKGDAIRRNLDLLNEFMKYTFENPEVMEKTKRPEPPIPELELLMIDTA